MDILYTNIANFNIRIKTEASVNRSFLNLDAAIISAEWREDFLLS